MLAAEMSAVPSTSRLWWGATRHSSTQAAFVWRAVVKRVRLTSSMMTSVGYDATAAILEIEFASGDIYQYLDVPQERYQLLMAAPSQGRAFHQLIRNAYQHRRVEVTQ